MNECMNERTKERKKEWMNVWMNEQKKERKNEWMYEWMNKRKNEWMNVWMNELGLWEFVGLALAGKDIVFRFIIEYYLVA